MIGGWLLSKSGMNNFWSRCSLVCHPAVTVASFAEDIVQAVGQKKQVDGAVEEGYVEFVNYSRCNV